MSLSELEKYHKAAAIRNKELMTMRNDKSKWTDDLQAELEELVDFMSDCSDLIDEKRAEAEAEAKAEAETKAYKVQPGSEDCVHLRLMQGDRFFDARTGEPIKGFTQIFNYGEWQNFKETHVDLGYKILEVLHDPYNEAQKFVVSAPKK